MSRLPPNDKIDCFFCQEKNEKNRLCGMACEPILGLFGALPVEFVAWRCLVVRRISVLAGGFVG